MKGKIFGSLFALLFFGVGVWMLWSISDGFIESFHMQSWVQVEAQLLRGGYDTHSGDDSNTYEAFAKYRYTYLGDSFVGTRVSLGSGADNIGDYQVDIGRNLSSAHASGETILVFVDPDNPAEAVIDRGVRWGMVGFKSIFLFVFGGFGLGLLVVMWRARTEQDKSGAEHADSPWLLNDAWQTATIRSSSRSAMIGAWIFAGIWNLISAPMPFVMYREVIEKENYIALVGLLFTIVGMGLLVWAIVRTLEWRRFGAAPVSLDPFPGSIGGHVGGTIDLNLPFDAATRFKLTLTHIHSYISGSGKNRSQKQKTLWQDTLIAHAEPASRGTRLTFRFDAPEGMHESDVEHDDSYYLWRLNLTAEMAGTDLDRNYDIPVYATAQQSQHLSSYAVEKSRAEQSVAADQSILKIVRIIHDASGRRMVYPPGRHLGLSIGGVVFGAIFAAVGWYLIVTEGQPIFGSVFGGIGALVASFALYTMINSLEVSRNNSGFETIRRVLGIPIRRKHMLRSAFDHFTKHSSFQSQSGNKHDIYYSIVAVDSEGNRLVVGEGFKGQSEANAAIRLISEELGLRAVSDECNDHRDTASLRFNALAPDN